MVKTASFMLPLGTPAPSFSLMDVVNGHRVSLPEAKGKVATVIMFLCNHCPYVKHINTTLTRVARDYQQPDIVFIAINANDVNSYPDDSPENMQKTAQTENYPFPYLFDETQEVATAYHAQCTPDFYVFNADLLLAYRGQFDSSRPGNGIEVTGQDLRHALDCLLTQQPIQIVQKPSLGCNIKWKP